MDSTNQTPENEPFGVEEPQAPAPSPGMPVPPTENDKMLSGLSYVSQLVLPAVMPIVLLISDEGKRSPFVRHHTVHSLALLVASIAYELVAAIASLIIGAIAPCLWVLLWILFFLPAVPFLYYGVKAFQGQYVDVPYVTDFLRRNNWL